MTGLRSTAAVARHQDRAFIDDGVEQQLGTKLDLSLIERGQDLTRSGQVVFYETRAHALSSTVVFGSSSSSGSGFSHCSYSCTN